MIDFRFKLIWLFIICNKKKVKFNLFNNVYIELKKQIK